MTILAKLLGCLLAVVVVNLAAVSAGDARQSVARSTTITVSAAASLTGVFMQLGKQFSQANPHVKVRFNFASSSSLVTQIRAGAPSDVFAAADLASFSSLQKTGQVNRAPRVFATNTMQLVVKPGNPLAITSVMGLAKASVVSLCAKTAPCGVYAQFVLKHHGVVISESQVSRGADVTATLGAVRTGDADAGLVYATDARAAKQTVQAIAIPTAKNVQVPYGIDIVRGTKHAKESEEFVKFVLSATGKNILASFGFRTP